MKESPKTIIHEAFALVYINSCAKEKCKTCVQYNKWSVPGANEEEEKASIIVDKKDENNKKKSWKRNQTVSIEKES